MKYEKWSLGYWCLRQYIRFIDWIIHKKVILTGVKNIPKNKVILLLGLPIFLIGFAANFIPMVATEITVRKKIKDQAFWSTFFLASGILLFPIVYLLELWAASSFLPKTWMKLLFLLLLPLSGKIAFRWYILFLKTLGRARILFIKLFNNTLHIDLQNKQKQLFEKLDTLIQTETFNS